MSAIGQSPAAKPITQRVCSAIATYSFSGKTILITGGAGEIGRATARRFAENGAGEVTGGQ